MKTKKSPKGRKAHKQLKKGKKLEASKSPVTVGVIGAVPRTPPMGLVLA